MADLTSNPATSGSRGQAAKASEGRTGTDPQPDAQHPQRQLPSEGAPDTSHALPGSQPLQGSALWPRKYSEIERVHLLEAEVCAVEQRRERFRQRRRDAAAAFLAERRPQPADLHKTIANAARTTRPPAAPGDARPKTSRHAPILTLIAPVMTWASKLARVLTGRKRS